MKMELEITSEQFNLIQDEIIRLEEELLSGKYLNDTWSIVNIKSRIEDLKNILSNQTIII